MAAAGGHDHGRDPREELRRVVARARRQLLARRQVEAQLAALPWSLLGAAALAVVLRLANGGDWLPPQTLVALVVATAAVPLLAGIALGMRRYSDVEVALLIDRRLGTQEVVTTATCLRESDDLAWSRAALDTLRARVGDRSVLATPLRRPELRHGAAVIAGLAALLAAVRVPPPVAAAGAAGGPDAKVVEVAKKLDEELAELAEKLDETTAPELVRQSLEEARAVARDMEKTGKREEALLALERLDQLAAGAQQRREALDSGALERALSSLEQSALSREAARAANDGDAARLEQELKNLAETFREGGDMDQREVERLAARLKEAAEALADGAHAELAAQLKALAEALERGDLTAAAEMLEQLAASGSTDQLAGEAGGDKALADARKLVQQALASMGRARPDAPPAGSEMAGGGPPDWGVGTTNESEGSGQMSSGRQADRQSAETSSWQEAYQALYESTRLEDSKGRSLRANSQVGEGEFIAVPTRQVASGPGEAAAPLVRLPAAYERAAEEALARDQVPPGYDDPVRRYFTSLGGSPAPPPKN